MKETEIDAKIREYEAILSNLKKAKEKNKDEETKEVSGFKRDSLTLITCKEAAKLYPMGENKFRELCHSKGTGFPCIKLGCRIYIVKEKLDDWLYDNAGNN